MQTPQSKHRALLVKFQVTINPRSESETVAAFDKIIEMHGGNKNAAIKQAILKYAENI